MLRAALLVLLVACSSPSAPPAQAARPVPRQITPRVKLPPAIQAGLPRHGIYAAGGGLMSASWRVVVDTDAMTIYGGSSPAANASSIGKLDQEATRPLSPRNRDLLMKLAADAWTEAPPAHPDDPTADYDEIFVVLDGDDTFYLEGFGPIRRPLAAKAIVELRAAAGL